MRKALVELGIIIVGIVMFHTIRTMRNGSINGKVYPANDAESVVAVNGNDSVRVKSTNGYFGMKVKPGIWKVIVAVKKQPGNVVMENLQVNQGDDIDLGEIRLAE
ncbi:MAG: hypothetical protein JST75_17835 [Bacteroidetes bacterium]|nr:hypothetical protein [Bacteroidota bacterium]